MMCTLAATFNPDRVLVGLAEWVTNALSAWPALSSLALILMSTVPLVAIFPGCFAVATWLERKGLGRFQNRIGPNRTGPFGLLQPAADGIKMLLKEDIVPAQADKFFHFWAPILAVVPAFLVLAVIPFGRQMVPAQLDIGVLYFFGVGSMSTLVVFVAGWASRNKYSMLGGMRAIAQVVSYEAALVLAAVPPIMAAGSMNTAHIVESQIVAEWVSGGNILVQNAGSLLGWHVFTPWGFCGFLLFFVASLAELNRSPFDLPEADSELVAGHLTEFSGFKYALFFLAEYVNLFAIAALAATLYLGGWSGPNFFWPAGLAESAPPAALVPGFVWLFAKMFAMLGVMIWIRATFPRLRVDQLMGFAWKFLLPLALANIVSAAFFIRLPWWAAWPISLGLSFGAYAALCVVNRQKGIGPREYRYA